MSQGRSLYKEIFKNFLKSITPRKIWGEIVGKDHFGTTYYEIPKDQYSHRARSARWFVPAVEDKFDQEIPPEWEAWLRHRRKLPPTEEEIRINLMKSQQTVEKAKKLEPERPVQQEIDEIKPVEKNPFPVYEEYNAGPEVNKTKN